MKNRISKSITLKIFSITTILLIISASLIFIILYSALPSYYQKYKKDNVQNGLNELTTTISKMKLQDALGEMDKFTGDYNVMMILADSDGKMVYMPSSFIKMNHSILDEDQVRPEIPYIFMQRTKRNWGNQKIYSLSKEVGFVNDSEEYVLHVNATMQPIDEASKVLLMFTPFVIIIVLVIAVTGAIIYSKIIAKPLIEINNTAKKMSHLDFEDQCLIKGEDEIGQLSSSLNEMSLNLQRNMDELRSANKKLISDIEKERELEKRRREFIATISHELKTPITILKGQLEGMIGNIGAYKDRDKYLNRSMTVLDSMHNIVKEILEISKLEAIGFAKSVESINLSSLVKRCIDDICYLAEKKNIKIVEFVEEDSIIFGDKKLINKAVANIINNAIIHTESEKDVYVHLHKSSNQITLEVENLGAYIPENEIEEIFKPFYRIDKSRNRITGGSGLGLYIVKQILDAHEAFYKVSNTDSGVKFKVVFRNYR